ncbi:MAG: 2,3-bisphosphoglycerate-dependent phosphoglycerate mutase [Acidobacteriota bacterium]|jgi:broad specificity phosphatase PhoE|nr:2,3-bisphosphoglycerate-dependent phosphoglycerate mutase [Acidobacteriota bacterium]
MQQLILVRHGETVHNVAGIAQGWNDSALSERGERQVRALAERLKSSGITAIYSSPLGRALATAELVAEATGLPVTVLDELREMNYGTWEGRSFLDVRQVDEEAYQRWINDEEAACPSGESHADVRRRLERAFAAMNTAKPVVITHGTAIRISVTALLELPVMTARHFAQDNAAINTFFRRGERWVLKVWNDTTHCGSPRE